MAATSSPYGIQPVSDQSGIVRPLRMPNGILNQYNSNIFKWQAVTLDPATGTLQAVTNPGGTPQPLFGIFLGAEFTPLGGRPTESPFWPAGTNVTTAENFFVYVWPCWIPGTRFKIQADGSVAQTLMGSQFNITNLAAGSTQTGLSTCTVGAAGVPAASQGQFTLVEFGTDVGDPDGGGDAFTDLICTIAYPQVGLGPQKSIG